MNRKLHTTFPALIASVLMFGMFGMFAFPSVTPQAAQASPAQANQIIARQSATATPKADAASARLEPALAARLDAVTLQLPRRAGHAQMLVTRAEPAVVTAMASTFEDTAAAPAALQTPRYKSGKSRRIRQSMAMPFFSFAPRG